MMRTTDPPARIEEFAASGGYTDLRPLGQGLEFLAFGATAADGSPVVLRTAVGARIQSNANDPYVDTRQLLRWEQSVTVHLTRLGFPVAAPRELVLGEVDVLISEYLPDDGRGADQQQLGALLRRLHDLPPPLAEPVAAEGTTPAELLPRRIVRRWRELAALVPDLPTAPDAERLAAELARPRPGGLVHLDVRAANLRCTAGRVRGLIDWSNAMVADPVLELARLAEFARLPGNGLDLGAVLAGYGCSGLPDSPTTSIYRLDAAVMLAVVFRCEAPDSQLGSRAVDRLREVRAQLDRELSR
ncbi:phosphotransferase family protein [Plantactinospora sp. BB1]|uniref:phosphotransferase family protein n=1 Tax=Plantactinospora sp. BB1 TaxID=2071627 RepID=UPI000D163BC5|nr:aminoglycoside phosphotransferase family protein [Plantactinospora sp. BB1]AVT38631.1 hypothetical protein C6W10_21770 [Plantactinospora sp. BB1]